MQSVNAEIKELVTKLSEKLTTVIKEDGHAGQPKYNDILEQLDNLKNIVNTLAVTGVELELASVIDQYGLGERLLALRESGSTPKAISTVLGSQIGQYISAADVSNWLENYSSLSVLQKPKPVIGSVFDTKNVMENIFQELYLHLDKVKNMKNKDFAQGRTTKTQVELEVYKEIRQLTKDAAGILESISNMERYKEFQRLIIESIGDVSPEVKHEIMRKLRDQKAIFSSLVPTN